MMPLGPIRCVAQTCSSWACKGNPQLEQETIEGTHAQETPGYQRRPTTLHEVQGSNPPIRVLYMQLAKIPYTHQTTPSRIHKQASRVPVRVSILFLFPSHSLCNIFSNTQAIRSNQYQSDEHRPSEHQDVTAAAVARRIWLAVLPSSMKSPVEDIRKHVATHSCCQRIIDNYSKK